MSTVLTDTTWMWHPDFAEDRKDTAGLFVHFRRSFDLTNEIPESLRIQITADTRYKLYINKRFVTFGPVKGDQNLWFYDEVNIAPYLQPGPNHIAVLVLRFFHATQFAPSFPRLPFGGLRVIAPEPWSPDIQGSEKWETAIDSSTILRIDDPEDRFLHIYERFTSGRGLQWTKVKLWEFRIATGNSTPWHLSPRIIPEMEMTRSHFSGVHNVNSTLPQETWEKQLLGGLNANTDSGLSLLPWSKHQLDLEVSHHTTGFIELCFQRQPFGVAGSMVKLTYAESYEDPPITSEIRRKSHRCDYSKSLFGPQDVYEINGGRQEHDSDYYGNADNKVLIRPFHFRTFRFIRLNIEVRSDPLTLHHFVIDKVNYPLEVLASIDMPDDDSTTLWDISVRTLRNCMHECYEDCPFYEQLQYAMDARSSALFTYYLSGDDRMARQAIIQLHNSFQPRVGLTLSRAPTHRPQIIPHFSLFWICMVHDHLRFFGDKAFAAQFVSIIDAVLGYFDNHVDPDLRLVRSENRPGIWSFIDWVEEWKPHGMSPVVAETGVSTYTNNLYVYTLNHASSMMKALGRHRQAEEYTERASSIVKAIRQHCFTGEIFTDGLASASTQGPHLSQHNQVWSVLSGAATGSLARDILCQSLDNTSTNKFVKTSTAMSFYTARALSLAGGGIYEAHFHGFWDQWRSQIALGLTTWEEDSVSHRSDCHAWGSVPIYEFMGEVAGISPAEPGWSAIRFAPRVSLYRKFEAKVPFNTKDGMCVACVSWDRSSSGDCKIHLRFRIASGPPSVTVIVDLPGKDILQMEAAFNMVFGLKEQDIQAGNDLKRPESGSNPDVIAV